MLVARYFLFVGGALLALLFLFGAVSPQLPVADRTGTAIDLPVVRIHSDRKWPEKVVFDTSIPTIVPAPIVQTAAAAPVPTPAAEMSAKARVRESFAQFRPAEENKPAPKLQAKRKIAKKRVAPPGVLVAQQPQFGFFANNTFFGNNSW
jgi:hypothetical protein